MTTDAVKKVPIPPRGVDYRGKIVLAPMVRSGELPSRLLALHYGADLVWGPETVDRSMIGTTRRVHPITKCIEWSRTSSNPQSASRDQENVIYRIHPTLESTRLIFQLGTSDPDRAVACARLVAPDVAGIDVNAGCPKPFSTSGGMGAALLRTPDRLCAILTALVAAITPAFGLGISVKIRLLDSPAETEALVRRLVATGITGLTVHCRTTPMRPRERAIRGQLRMVAGVCREAGVACLMNGDVEGRAQAVALMDEFGVDGAMIATAAERNPSCFRAEGPVAWQEAVERYLGLAMDVGNRFGNTKFLVSQMVPGKAPQYQLFQSTRSYTSLCERLGYEHLQERARDVDAMLGIEPNAEKVSRKQGKKNKAALAAGGKMAEARAVDRENKRKSLTARGVEPVPEVAQHHAEVGIAM